MRQLLPLGLRAASAAGLAAVILVLSGCGGGGQVPVSGKVTNGDKPLTKGSVRFIPEAGSDVKTEPSGDIKEDGTYTISAFGKPGAPPGTYKVTVDSSVPSNPKDPYSAPKSLINSKYTIPEKTDLKVTVSKDAAPGAYDLKLTP